MTPPRRRGRSGTPRRSRSRDSSPASRAKSGRLTSSRGSQPTSRCVAAVIALTHRAFSPGSASTTSTGMRHVSTTARTGGGAALEAMGLHGPRRLVDEPAHGGVDEPLQESLQPLAVVMAAIASGSASAAARSQRTTATSPTRSSTVPGRSGSATAGSIPAASISEDRPGSRGLFRAATTHRPRVASPGHGPGSRSRRSVPEPIS